jgi:hypothetical protein
MVYGNNDVCIKTKITKEIEKMKWKIGILRIILRIIKR